LTQSVVAFEPIPTSIAGVNSGPEAETRQDALRRLARLQQEQDRPIWLDLVRDKENPADPDAIQVFANVPELGRVQLGFVRNADCTCELCDKNFARFPEGGVCPKCGAGRVIRCGLASKICRKMEADPSLAFYGQVLQVTGGQPSQGKNQWGCNILIRARTQTPQLALDT
jgi:hypothetical protein